MLTGVVDFGTQKAAAAEAVAGLVGVRNIRNKIEINNTADPIDVLMNVQDALDRNSLVGDDSDVRVDTDDHCVTLTGGVRTWPSGTPWSTPRGAPRASTTSATN